MLLLSLFTSVALIGIGVEAQATSTRTSTTSTRARTTSVPPTSTSTSTSTTASSVAAATHTVAVGADGFKFQPNRITAEKGDTVLFRFYPGGHAVARSDFEFPCIPYELTGVNHVGFFSKIQTPHVVSNDLPTFSVKINDTQPIFFYCSAPGSCVDHHMIGAINPNSTQTLEKQEEAVKKASLQLTPGDAWPSETARPTTPTPAAGAADGQQEGPALGPGQIAGIAIGGTAALALIGALLFICGRRSGRGLPWSKEDGAAAVTNPLTPRLGEGGTPLAANAAPLDVKQQQQQQQHQHQHTGTFPSPSHSPFATTVSPYSAAATAYDPYRAAGVAHHPYHPHHYQNVVPPPQQHLGNRTPPYSPGSFLAYQPIPGHGPQHQQYMPHHSGSTRSAPNWAAPRPGAHAAYELPPPSAPVELSAAPRSPAFQAYQQSRQFSFSHNADRGFTPGPRP